MINNTQLRFKLTKNMNKNTLFNCKFDWHKIWKTNYGEVDNKLLKTLLTELLNLRNQLPNN